MANIQFRDRMNSFVKKSSQIKLESYLWILEIRILLEIEDSNSAFECVIDSLEFDVFVACKVPEQFAIYVGYDFYVAGVFQHATEVHLLEKVQVPQQEGRVSRIFIKAAP